MDDRGCRADCRCGADWRCIDQSQNFVRERREKQSLSKRISQSFISPVEALQNPNFLALLPAVYDSTELAEVWLLTIERFRSRGVTLND